MRSLLFTVLMLALVPTTASTASAQRTSTESDQASAPTSERAYERGRLAPPPRFTAGDWVLSTLAGDAGLAAGGFGGFMLGAALAGSCTPRPDEYGLNHCSFHGFAEGAVGLVTLAPVGAATGIYLYGEARGHHGSYWGALAGSALGMATTAGVFMAAHGEDEGMIASFAMAAILPSLAGTAGYYLSRDTQAHPAPVATSGALIDLGRDGVVRLGVPNVKLSTDPSAPAVGLTVFGGAL